jgi:transcriptional regulator with XRE-family HTH domain
MDEQIRAIAERIRNLREIFNCTDEEVAKAAGVTLEYYRKLEAGEEDFSFSVLYNIARKFNVDITSLLTGEDARLKACTIVRKDQGLRFSRKKEYKYNHLAYAFKDKKMEPFIVTVEYEGDPESNPKIPNTHDGHEFTYVIEGRLRLIVNGHKYDLNEGDAAYFDSSFPHSMYALDGKRAKFISVITSK